ncbi:MAG: sulfur carrier protein ThiS [Candidatus Eremiobacteraeota bacterium]|nr:sulfur carrier protein ThiS [Candidatus Eremiobacteraeota bacterium]
MKATINGEARELETGLTFAELLDQLGVSQSGIAVARNDQVLRRGALGEERIREGDRIEIIRAVAGG